MAKHHTFARDDVFPSWWPNAIAEQVGVIVENFEVRKASDTTIEVPASTASGLAVVGIDGKWRFRSTTATRSHPGGAAGTYPIFVVGEANEIVSSPLPFTDTTNYDWDLRIEAPGGTPTIVAGTVDFYRKVGEAVWDGTKITRVRQLVGQVSTRPTEPTARRVDETPFRAVGIAGQTADLARVEDSAGVARLSVGPSGGISSRRSSSTATAFEAWVDGDGNARLWVDSKGAIEWGDGSARDVRLERGSADMLLLVDELRVTRPSGVALNVRTTGDPSDRFHVEVNGDLWWGPGSAAPDVQLTRGGANVLSTGVGDGFRVRQVLEAQGDLFHSGLQFGAFGGLAVQDVGWNNPFSTGLTGVPYRAPLQDSTTLLNLIRYVATMANALKGYGLLGF